MENLKIRGQWYVDEDGNIKHATLREWFDFLHVELRSNNHFHTNNSHAESGFLPIYRRGGYGMKHEEVEQYMDRYFYAVNLDIDGMYLMEA